MFPDGICRVSPRYYSKTIQFWDVNYQLAQQEDQTAIFDEWCSFLHFFDASIHFQFSFVNSSTDPDAFARSIRIPPRNDGFNDVRAEYSAMLRSQLAQGNNGLTKTKYLTFGIEAENLKSAKPRLEHIQTDILNNLHKLGVAAKPLGGKERLHLMHDLFHMGDRERFQFEWDWLAACHGAFGQGLYCPVLLRLSRSTELPDGSPSRCHELSIHHGLRSQRPGTQGVPGHGFYPGDLHAHPVRGSD